MEVDITEDMYQQLWNQDDAMVLQVIREEEEGLFRVLPPSKRWYQFREKG